MKLPFILLAAAGGVLLSGCTDDASLCREPGYTCADHVSEKDHVCILPGYTCTEPDEDDSRSPITGKRKGDAGDGSPGE